MSQAAQFNGDIYVTGNIAGATMTFPAGAITDAAINSGAAIASTKHIDRDFIERELFGPTTTIVAVTTRLCRMTAPATIIAFSGEIYVDASDVSRTVTVDLQKSTGGGAFATVLSVTINITNTTTIRTAVAATISSAALVSGDILQAICSVAGGAGVQAQGLGITLVIDRSPQ